MKKTLTIAAAAAFLVSGLVATEAGAKNYVEKKCSSCHSATKDKTGPSWATIQAAYGSPEALAAVIDGGFKVEDRKVAASDPKWAGKVKQMTPQYKKLIEKKHKSGADIAADVFSIK